MLLFPTQCLGCGEWGRALCKTCFAQSIENRRFLRFFDAAGNFIPGVSFGDYRGVLRQLIIGAKHDPLVDLSVWLRAAGELLGEALSERLAAPELVAAPEMLVVPVPSRRKRQREGMLLTPTLAAGVVAGLDNFGVPARVLAGVGLKAEQNGLFAALRQSFPPGQSQQGLGARERRSSKTGSMTATADVNGQSVILVDDVLTTGATMRETVRAVAAGGGRVVAVVCLADLQR